MNSGRTIRHGIIASGHETRHGLQRLVFVTIAITVHTHLRSPAPSRIAGTTRAPQQGSEGAEREIDQPWVSSTYLRLGSELRTHNAGTRRPVYAAGQLPQVNRKIAPFGSLGRGQSPPCSSTIDRLSETPCPSLHLVVFRRMNSRSRLQPGGHASIANLNDTWLNPPGADGSSRCPSLVRTSPRSRHDEMRLTCWT